MNIIRLNQFEFNQFIIGAQELSFFVRWSLRHGLRDQNHFCTRQRRDVSQLSINASFFKSPLTDADVKIWIGKILLNFLNFTHFICNINDILLKTVNNNTVACLCNAFYTNLSLWKTTRRHLTCVVRTQTSTWICPRVHISTCKAYMYPWLYTALQFKYSL